MNLVYRRIIVWIGLVISLCGGCQSADVPSTPELAVANLHRALLRNDGEAFTDCFDAAPDERDLLLALFDLMQETGELEQALIKTYGREAVDGKIGRQYPYSELRDEKALEETKIGREGPDAAMVFLPRGKRKVRIHQKDGRWLFPMEHMVPPFVNRANDRVTAIHQMAGVIRDTRNKVGKEGQDPKIIQQDMRIGLWQLVDEWKKQKRAKSAN
jgi:hypothetical protein